MLLCEVLFLVDSMVRSVLDPVRTKLMRRRDFITILGGAAAAWPLAAYAQQPDRMRRIGVLMDQALDDPDSSPRTAAFLGGLQQLGWTDGRNVRIDTRWSAGNADLQRRYAAELVALAPDVILATASPTVAALQAATRTVPIVFAHAADSVGAGFVDSLARPGGNTTGFILFEYGISPKWLELLKEFAPRVTRVAVLRDPAALRSHVFSGWNNNSIGLRSGEYGGK